MRRNYIIIFLGLLFISSAITGYVTLELRVHKEYQDYREHLFLECMYCPALAYSISSEYHIKEWSLDDFCKISLSPWIKAILRAQNVHILFNADVTCKHFWNRQFINGNRPTSEMWPTCFMPLKFFQVQKLTTCFFYILCLLSLICLAHVFLLNKFKVKNRNVWFITVWGLLSVLVLVFSNLFPVGVPLTAILREYRVLSKHINENPEAMRTRVDYMLSNEIFHEMAQNTPEIIPQNYSRGRRYNSSEVRDYAFPFRCWKRSQACLAATVAQYDAAFAGRFFYGPDFTVDDNLTNLTTRLAKQLVNLNDGSIGNEKPFIKKVLIRKEGVVDVLWSDYEMPDNFFLTTYKLYYLNDKKIWIPIRNVCEGIFHAGYNGMNKLITW